MSRFKIDTRKAIEAAGTLLRLTHCRMMDRKRLLALLFIVDRTSLERTGRPIVGGKIVAMKHGPIHSEVYDLIKGGGIEQAEWSSHFENEDYRVRLSDDELRLTALSRYEIELINEISTKFAGFGTWDVANATHTDEYNKNYVEGTSTEISLEDLIDGVGLKASKAEIVRDAEEKAYFDKLFSGKQ
jgi:uncharacterized phage-associated protein